MKLRVRNWARWQSYRTDRGAPPWIKVHRNLASNPDWASMSDAEKGQLVSMWLMAADRHGELPADPKIIRKICLLDDTPDIDRFVSLGFLELLDDQTGDVVTPTRRQDDANTTSSRRRFIPPTEDQVSEFAGEQNIEIDAGKFIDFYASKGWLIGKSPMKCWRSAVRNWARRQQEQRTGTPRDQRLQDRETMARALNISGGTNEKRRLAHGG